jgi:hypothetical protein
MSHDSLLSLKKDWVKSCHDSSLLSIFNAAVPTTPGWRESTDPMLTMTPPSPPSPYFRMPARRGTGRREDGRKHRLSRQLQFGGNIADSPVGNRKDANIGDYGGMFQGQVGGLFYQFPQLAFFRLWKMNTSCTRTVA